MADSNYIVLKAEDSFVPTFENLGTGGPTAGTRGGPNAQVAAQKVELEEVSMSSTDADDLRRDPRTVAVAPPMPLTLISPVASDDGDGPDILASGNTWGVEAVQADSSNFDGSGVKMAVLDTGIDPNHPAFAGVNLVRKNFTAESDDDIHGHGTHLRRHYFRPRHKWHSYWCGARCGSWHYRQSVRPGGRHLGQFSQCHSLVSGARR